MIKNTYTLTALNVQSKRANKRSVKAFDEDDARAQILVMGLAEPIQILDVSIELSSDSQRAYATSLGIAFNNSVGRVELSDRISFHLHQDILPSIELTNVATELNLEFSTYMGEKRMATIILQTLSSRSVQIAFYIACVYQLIKKVPLTGDDFQSQQSPFLSFGKKMASDGKFLSSFDRELACLSESWPVLFSTSYIDHFFQSRAYALEKCEHYLRYKFLINRPKKSQSENPSPSPNNAPSRLLNDNGKSKSKGCLLNSAVLVLLSTILLAWLLASCN